MKKLKSKVFWTVVVILTLFSLSIFTVSNVQSYRQEYRATVSRFNRVDAAAPQGDIPPDSKDTQPDGADTAQNDPSGENIRFADAVVYTVMLSSENEIESIINHSDNQTSDSEIKETAQEFLSKGKSGVTVGNLYFSNYSYSLTNGVSLTIIDNSMTNEKLTRQLVISLIMFLIIEAAVLFAAKKITVWIIKPVEESFEKQKQFIADASHELKTPLAVIMASSDALEREPQEKKWLTNIKSESERMNKLITSLLDLAKSEQITSNAFERCNVSKIIETSLLAFEGIMFEKNVRLEYNIEKDVVLDADPDSIKQLTAILADNAVCHSVEKSVIEVNLYKKDKKIFFEVTNEGEAIPQGEETKIFERFYRCDKSRNRDENRYGLGLAIAKGIVDAHGGKISASSCNGKTTFRVVFAPQ